MPYVVGKEGQSKVSVLGPARTAFIETPFKHMVHTRMYYVCLHVNYTPLWIFFLLFIVVCCQVCECLGLEWGQTIPQQFNNVAVALLTLFEISTTEAWTAVTYAAVDSTTEDMQPITGNVIWRVWYFILFMLVGAYLVMNLFVGVVVDNFKKVG